MWQVMRAAFPGADFSNEGFAFGTSQAHHAGLPASPASSASPAKYIHSLTHACAQELGSAVASGVRALRVDVLNRSDSVHPPGKATTACRRCMSQLARSSHGSIGSSALVGACASRGKAVKRTALMGDTYWYPCVLSQDQRVPVPAVVDAVRRAVLAW